ncbi:MAG: DNA mismatch repair protein MutS [Candidatus Saliniplasma sp.]
MTDRTPMMEQYYKLKSQYPDSILFFRMGDFYEMFDEDAKLAADELDIALTSREKGKSDPIPMAGVPYHSVDSYLQRLIKNGYTVAIAEQVEDPSKAKGLVDREVVRVVTPGTVIDEGLLDGSSNNFLVSIVGDKQYGLAAVDISTGDFLVTQLEDEKALLSEIVRYEPSECILPSNLAGDEEFESEIKEEVSMMVNKYKDEAFRYHPAKSKLAKQFNTDSLEPLGIKGKKEAIRAAGSVLDYIEDTQKRTMDYIHRLRFYSHKDYMTLDATTLKNLEIFQNLRESGKAGTLLEVMDETVTSMGCRKLRKWLQQPLLDIDAIDNRLDAVEELKGEIFLRDDIRKQMDGMSDIERLISRVVYGNANARDLISIKNVLSKLGPLLDIIDGVRSDYLQHLKESLDPLEDILELIDDSIVEDPPNTVKDGGIIKKGFDETLDDLKRKTKKGKDWISSLERKEKDRTDIETLKVGYNKVHGYYLEVPKTQIEKVPENYSRKQTLKNSERYYTDKLKDKEEEIISSEEKMEALEYEIFKKIRTEVGNQSERFQRTAEVLAKLDVISTFAHLAVRYDYNRPDVGLDGRLDIRDGRHPVVEKTVESFVPNNALLDMENNRYIIITGPNMSGKSTYMRQNALITLLAQVGSFVPSEKAHIGVVDRIFTRVGALDALTKGKSTFMVEMTELANILHNASQDSLILLDEIGSGTSTFDGLSIAWAVTEYINNNIKAKTLFATHYHEITKLEKSLKGVKNLHVAVNENEGEVTFLRKVREGHTDESYGIHVASLAGVPEPVVQRAIDVLNQIEEDHTIKMESRDSPKFKQVVFDPGTGKTSPESHPVIEEVKKMDLENMTPLEAMNELWRLRKKIED